MGNDMKGASVIGAFDDRARLERFCAGGYIATQEVMDRLLGAEIAKRSYRLIFFLGYPF